MVGVRGLGLGRILPERGGGRTCRRWERGWPLANWGGGGLPTTRTRLLTSLGVIGRAIYSPERSVPAAVDKNAGEPPFCSQGARGGDGR